MNEAGFEWFFRATFPDAMRVARRILTTEADAEDASAEAFARAHASWQSVGALPHRKAWLLRVTGNVAIDMARKRSRRSVVALDDADDPAETAVLKVALAAALAQLPKRQREIVVLRYLEGYSEADTAEVLSISVGTVKKATHRATRALRECLGTDWRTFGSRETDAAY